MIAVSRALVGSPKVDKFPFMDPHLKPCSANRLLGKRLYNRFLRAANIRHILNWEKFALWILTRATLLTLADPRLLHPTMLLSIVYVLLIHRFHGLWENRSSTGPAARSLGKIPGKLVGGPSTHPGSSYKMLRAISSMRPGLSRSRKPCL